MQSVKTKDVVAYATLPRILPRVKDFCTSGFGYIPFLMAQIYAMVKLLPENHPYLSSKNINRFGVRHVVSEAAKNLEFKKNKIDQIIVFFAILSGVVLLVIQFFMLLYAFFTSHAIAGPFSWFDTTNPQTDIAYELMDRVFGVPEVFCSFAGVCTNFSTDTNGVGPGTPTIPTPFHTALHELFRFYSTGLLIIAVLIFLYFIVVVVLETAVSGTPFGQRFQNVWVPVRLVVAISLLMPVPVATTAPYGPMGTTLNSAQYITLYVAKYGSSFATNGWRNFNDAVGSHPLFAGAGPTPETSGNPLGERYAILALPETPDITPVVELMSVVHACAYSYFRQNDGDGISSKNGYTYTYTSDYRVYSAFTQYPIMPYLVKKPTAAMLAADGVAIGGSPIVGNALERLPVQTISNPNYMQALGFYYGGDIVIRFGEFRLKTDGSGEPVYDDEGGVRPLCGDVRIPISDLSNVGDGAPIAQGGSGANEGGADYMQAFYYQLILDLWFNEDRLRQFATNFVSAIRDHYGMRLQVCSDVGSVGIGAVGQPATIAPACTGDPRPASGLPIPPGVPTVDWRNDIVYNGTNGVHADLTVAIRRAWADYIQNYNGNTMTSAIIDRGWGGAGIWYTRIAEINGGFIDGVLNMPTMDKLPFVWEYLKEQKRQSSKNTDVQDPFNPAIFKKIEKDVLDQAGVDVEHVAKPLHAVYKYWNDDWKNVAEENKFGLGNHIMHAMHMLLGTSGLVQMRTTNSHLHPLAQLTAVGKGLVESVIRNMGAATVFSFMGGFFGDAGAKEVSGVFSALSQIFLSMAFIGIVAGFILYYILPFLPFVYFYFAVASWVKGIFEAMVGVPLWALAHLRIDGEGLPGDAAQNGYFMLLDVFVRPILTVFGLIAAIVIFATQVRILNLIWDLVTANASGFTPGQDIILENYAQDLVYQRSIIDQFFLTIIYAVIVYMLGLASFKLIDRIPDNILRWAGAGVSAFGDIEQDDIGSLNRYASMGAMTIGSDMSSMATGTASQAGSGLSKALGMTGKLKDG